MPQPLPSKETSLFRDIIRLYEVKQYKKALKNANQILSKFPKHADTTAMKALLLNAQGDPEKAFELSKEALQYDFGSHICWHVYGLIHRAAKNIDQAVKAYKRALQLLPGSPQLLRDLALLQMQMRDHKGHIETRTQMVKNEHDPVKQRQGWSALAVGHHLAGDLKKAEEVISGYQKDLKEQPSPYDLEYVELCLYKNSLIAEMGQYDRALADLESLYMKCPDRTLVMELKAKYLLKLDRLQEAAQAYRALLERNSDKREYYAGLEHALQLDRARPDHVKKLSSIYAALADRYPTADAARRIPLDFLSGPDFEKAADRYIRRKLNYTVPATFFVVRGLYADPEKAASLSRIVDQFIKDADSDDEELKKIQVDLLYFVAQHFTFTPFRDLPRALQIIDRAIDLSPKTIDLYMTKARILKHDGNMAEAVNALKIARELDRKDRHIATKLSRYLFRLNDNEGAMDHIRPFLRNDSVSGPQGDILTIQSIWCMTEDGEAYLRQQNYNLALKRLLSVDKVFDVWYEDQTDFHAFSFMKGGLRSYVDIIRWEDNIFALSSYSRAMLTAVKIYTIIHDDPRLAKTTALNGLGHLGQMEDALKKKTTQKAARIRERNEAERKELARKTNIKPTVEPESKKPDPDPLGFDLVQTKQPLEEAAKLLGRLLEFSSDLVEVHLAAFDVYVRQQQLEKALAALNKAAMLDPENPGLVDRVVTFRLALEKAGDEVSDEFAAAVAGSAVPIPASEELLAGMVSEYLSKHKDSADHVQAGLRARQALRPEALEANVADLIESVDLPAMTFKQAELGLEMMWRDWKVKQADAERYRARAASRWPQASVFCASE